MKVNKELGQLRGPEVDYKGPCPHPVLSFPIPCGTVYLPGHMGCYAHPAYLPALGGARPLRGAGGVSISNGNEIPSLSVLPGAALLDLDRNTALSFNIQAAQSYSKPTDIS